MFRNLRRPPLPNPSPARGEGLARPALKSPSPPRGRGVGERGAWLALLLALLFFALPARAIEVKRVVSPGGIEAWLIEDHKNPVIGLEWAFEGAGATDPEGKEGLANLAASTLDEGAGPLDSQAFQGRLQDIATSLSFDAARDGFFGSLRTLKDNAADAFELARLAMTEPRFDQDAIDRVRGAILASLRRDLADPNYVARRAFYSAAFPDHPYGGEVRGTFASLPRIGADDLRAFAKGQLGRDRLVVAASGAITPADLGKALDAVFGGLPAKAAGAPLADTTPKGAGQTILVPRPMGQTVMLMGQPGVKRDDADWYAASVMNYVLGGGGFGSRLMEEVREKRGLSYGVYSYLVPLDHAALVLASGSTVNAKAGEALSIMRQEWKRMADEGLTEQELADAKTYLTGSFPLQFNSTSAIARILLQVKRDDLGIDYLDKRDAYINAVTRADVQRVARRLLDPAALLTVLVGRPEGVTPTRTVEDGG